MIDAESKKLAGRIIAFCSKQNITLSTAESCTGGLISAAITSVSGASAVFKAGYITYSNDSKEKMLGVSADTLKTAGAVSEETVREMALGAQQLSDTDLSLAISGIAGPTGGTDEKPVGLVYIGWARKGGKHKVRKFQFKGTRDAIRQSATHAALSTILIEIGAVG